MRSNSSFRRSRSTALAVAALLAALPAVAEGQAQNEVPPRGEGPQVRHPEAADAIDQLWSPYCPGLMLEVCPSGGGAALRDSLQQLAEQGKSSEELVEWVLANHGEEYRAMPEPRGTALLAWVAPPLGLLLGIGVVVLVLQRMRASRPRSAPSGPLPHDPSEEEERRLREALKELDEAEEAPFF